jgi:hypothetical protein
MAKSIKNIAASVHHHLINTAKGSENRQIRSIRTCRRLENYNFMGVPNPMVFKD